MSFSPDTEKSKFLLTKCQWEFDKNLQNRETAEKILITVTSNRD